MIQISHLRALSTFVVEIQIQRQVIIHDTKETLKWLNDNVEGFEEILYDLQYEDIFLNVDDPSSTEPWIWTNANQLVFETQDINAASIRYVRNFLLPYDKLLRAAGVLQVFHPQYPIYNVNEFDSATLRSIRTGFNDLRKKGLWTDVVFVAGSDEDPDPPLVAHRSFLSAFSDYFSDAFCREFAEAQDASSSHPIEFPARKAEDDYYSTRCVQLLLG